MKPSFRLRLLRWLMRRAIRKHNHRAYFATVKKIAKIEAAEMVREKLKHK